MAIYHCSFKVHSRSAGKSAVASAAYRSAERLHDERLNQPFDYTRKQSVDHTEIVKPDHASNKFLDRNFLHNEIERIEKRKDSQLLRECEVALPKELNLEQQKKLVRDFVQNEFVSKGMIADVAIHESAGQNPHAHILLSTRDVEGESFTKKNRSWNSKDQLKNWREGWEKQANKALKKSNINTRIDHRSLKAQGSIREPGIKHFNNPERIATNNAIKNRNIKRLAGKIKKIAKDIKKHVKAFGDGGGDRFADRRSNRVKDWWRAKIRSRERLQDLKRDSTRRGQTAKSTTKINQGNRSSQSM